jgi:hypothetical protein
MSPWFIWEGRNGTRTQSTAHEPGAQGDNTNQGEAIGGQQMALG